MNTATPTATKDTTPVRGIRDISLGWRLVGLAVAVFLGGIAFGLLTPGRIFTLPEATDGSLSDAAVILRSNLTLLFVIAACAGFQRFARDEVDSGSRPWIKWITTAIIVVFITLNVWTTGVVIGHLGLDAVMRIVPHAPFEIGAFVLGIIAYLEARRDELTGRRAALLFGTATALMIVGALIETYVSGGLT